MNFTQADMPALRKLMSLEFAAGGLLRTSTRSDEGQATLRMNHLTNTGPHRKLRRVGQSVEVEPRETTVEELTECLLNQSTEATEMRDWGTKGSE